AATPAVGTFLKTLANPTPATTDVFGWVVAASGDYIAVGAPLDDTLGTNTGAVYLFDGRTGSLLRTFTLATAGQSAAAGDEFGYALALSGDYLLVGTPYVDTAGRADAGAAYLFSVRSGSFLRLLTQPAPLAFADFGFAVA